jgi:hypothetical protein
MTIQIIILTQLHSIIQSNLKLINIAQSSNKIEVFIINLPDNKSQDTKTLRTNKAMKITINNLKLFKLMLMQNQVSSMIKRMII